MLEAERASLFMVDAERGELWLQVAQEEGGKPVEFRMPITAGVAGDVASTGRSARIDDAYRDPRFNPAADRMTGFRTRSILCVPIRDSEGEVFAVAQLLNRRDGQPFDQDDEATFRKLIDSVGVILKVWSQMSQHRS
jgi:adenylate cyclase